MPEQSHDTSISPLEMQASSASQPVLNKMAERSNTDRKAYKKCKK